MGKNGRGKEGKAKDRPLNVVVFAFPFFPLPRFPFFPRSPRTYSCTPSLTASLRLFVPCMLQQAFLWFEDSELRRATTSATVPKSN